MIQMILKGCVLDLRFKYFKRTLLKRMSVGLCMLPLKTKSHTQVMQSAQHHADNYVSSLEASKCLTDFVSQL